MAETLFQCDDLLWRRFVTLCKARDETPGAVLRDLVRLEVQRSERRTARSAEGIDERLLVRLRLLVAEALASSESWGQLQRALGERGLKFVPSGGGLVLADFATGETLAKSSQVGPPYMALVRQFGTGFPGHPQPGIAAQALSRA
ncbi:hypothetical protein [Tabrizicola sp.]|uniref:hypothetical protein n=1 Tax=Tabrizicola sp. TaxID=2005166 RepID=UPI00273589FA|nr:hypothetical protein [Tabrizicola sp.]MDP3195849.1 hypothetical protein [Tabrizicola sp.]